MRNYPRKIYAIKHNVTNRVYIGSTSQKLKIRYAGHIGLLRKGKHTSKLMQKDFNEYGENYTVYEIGIINSYEERFKEYQYMEEYGTFSDKYGYNQGDYFRFHKENAIKMTFSKDNNELIKHGQRGNNHESEKVY